MSFTVWFDETHVFGPGDLAKMSTASPAGRIVVLGEPNRDKDLGRWSGPIGDAVLRGASVVRRTH